MTETGDVLQQVPAAHLPDALDVLIVVGGLAGAAFLYLMATRVVPLLAVWEVQEGLLLRVRRQLVRLGVWVVAKPE